MFSFLQAPGGQNAPGGAGPNWADPGGSIEGFRGLFMHVYFHLVRGDRLCTGAVCLSLVYIVYEFTFTANRLSRRKET